MGITASSVGEGVGDATGLAGKALVAAGDGRKLGWGEGVGVVFPPVQPSRTRGRITKKASRVIEYTGRTILTLPDGFQTAFVPITREKT